MGSKVGNHRGRAVVAGRYVFSDGSIAWGAYTAAGARYDIKSFTVRLAYTLLV